MRFDFERYRFDQSKSTITGENSYMKSTKHWFCLWIVMKILKEWILVGRLETNVYGQVKSWIDGGLEPRAVTRDLDWGDVSG
jgi:methionyl-tRNA synthetase